MVTMRPSDAREFWKALMDNASALIADANVLLGVDSFGRARSLTVLAQEELGKALWIYDEFAAAWSTGDDTAREVSRLEVHGRSHVQKYLEAFVFGDDLAFFWGDSSRLRPPGGESREEDHSRRQREAEGAARRANLDKQAGFYVDRGEGGAISSPTATGRGDIDRELQTAAQVVEMLLIQDHSRMKMYARTPYDSTHEQQFRLLPISHPDDWAAASEEFKRGGPSPA
jgi:AbiV family abortive infection protein